MLTILLLLEKKLADFFLDDCYKILGVEQTASIAEIKTAFRRKAKLLHPDLSKENSKNTKEFQTILKAYQSLLAARERSVLDEAYMSRYSRKSNSEESFDYRRWLMERTDEESRCKLIFFDLMHNREDDAVEEYKKVSVCRVDFSLSRWFTREDFMDFGFILAEELIFREEFYEAYLLLAQIIRMEYSYSYFRHFFPEVMDLMRNLIRTKLAGTVSDELALDAWEDALDLGFGKKDEAYILRLMAEAYDRLGDTATAELCLKKALQMDSSLSVSARFRRKYAC